MYGRYNNVRMVGVAATVPEHTVKNEELISIYDEKTVKKQIRATGILERRCAVHGQNTLDLCYLAANRLLDELGWERETIQLVVFVSAHPVFASPGNAFYLQRKLGIGTECLAFDISMACSGFVVGIETVGAFMQTCPKGTRALLVAGATPNETLDAADRAAALMYGDASGAAAFEVEEGFPIFYSQFSDGTQMEYLFRRVGEPPHMNGMKLFGFAIKEVADSINSFFDTFKIDHAEMDYYFLQQVHRFMFEKIVEFSHLPPEKCPLSCDVFGNTAVASIPVTMSRHAEKCDFGGRKKLFLCGFGGGLSWGNVMLETEDLLVLPLEASDERLEMEECLC